MPQAIAIVKAEAIPLFAVQDIYELPPEQQAKSKSRRIVNRQPTTAERWHQAPKQKGFSKKWQGKWITQRELNRGNWMNKTGLKYQYGLSQGWINRLEAWLAEQENPVRLQTNPHHPNWAPMRLYDAEAVVGFMRLHEFELKQWEKRYRR